MVAYGVGVEECLLRGKEESGKGSTGRGNRGWHYAEIHVVGAMWGRAPMGNLK